MRATWVEVNLAQLRRNLEAIRTYVSPAKIMLIVKANAYGHGMEKVAEYIGQYTDYLGVAVVEEGIHLRNLGVKTPILVLGGIWGDQVPLYLKHDLTLTASSVERLVQINSAAESLGKRARVHLKIDTGMGRIGVQHYSARTIQEATLKCRFVDVEGIFSHFANADALDLKYAYLQLERFSEVLRFYEKLSLPLPIRHMANSAALLQVRESIFDMVRPGILFYGVYPGENLSHKIDVKPALTWKARVVYFKIVNPGYPISYGSTWESDHPVRIITLPVGYGDGYFRSMSNKAQVLLKGKKYPQVGRICMDQTMVNIENDSAYNGDEVVLLGESAGEIIGAENLAEWAGTIPYEILTNINTRVPRTYFEE